MQWKASQIAQLLNGIVVGDPEITVSRFDKIEEATNESLSFVANPKYEQHAYTTKAAVLLVNESFIPEKPIGSTLIKVKDAYQSLGILLEMVNKSQRKNGIEAPSFISKNARVGNDIYLGAFSYLGENVVIGDRVQIYPNCYIGDNVTIDDDTTIFSGVNIYSACKIGKSCVIHSGTVIGSDGFGFAPQDDGSYKKIPQTGNVVIEDHVEIGSNVSIDRATLGSTKIGRGVKLDNLVQIAHNVEIGENTVIAAQTGVSGSTRIDKNCMIGGQVGFVGHIYIAEGSKINAQSGISKSIHEPNKAWNGTPAFEFTASQRSNSLFRHLPEMESRISELEKLLKSQS